MHWARPKVRDSFIWHLFEAFWTCEDEGSERRTLLATFSRAVRMLSSRDGRTAECLRSGRCGCGRTRVQHLHRLSNVNGNPYFAFDGSPASATATQCPLFAPFLINRKPVSLPRSRIWTFAYLFIQVWRLSSVLASNGNPSFFSSSPPLYHTRCLTIWHLSLELRGIHGTSRENK